MTSDNETACPNPGYNQDHGMLTNEDEPTLKVFSTGHLGSIPSGVTTEFKRICRGTRTGRKSPCPPVLPPIVFTNPRKAWPTQFESLTDTRA